MINIVGEIGTAYGIRSQHIIPSIIVFEWSIIDILISSHSLMHAAHISLMPFQFMHTIDIGFPQGTTIP